MPVLLKVPEVAELLPIAGVRMGITQAGIRKANRDDLSVFLKPLSHPAAKTNNPLNTFGGQE